MDAAVRGEAIEAAVQAVLPPGLAVAWADPSVMHDLHYPEEAAIIAKAVERRRREFSAGRAAARRAMARLGHAPAPIRADTHRAPIWPAGIVGSITHCEGCCIAVAASAKQIRGVGIDVELLAPLDPTVTDIIATENEQTAIASGAFDLITLFCAKESAIKCKYAHDHVSLFKMTDIECESCVGGFLLQFGPDDFYKSHIKIIKGEYIFAFSIKLQK
jgi:4'-phosphopantetheinyl transferase EntD